MNRSLLELKLMEITDGILCSPMMTTKSDNTQVLYLNYSIYDDDRYV